MRLLDLRLCAMHLATCVPCCDSRFFFSLCQRIFDFCLRSFAPAGATSPCQSQRAGPQRFLVWVRVCWCCVPEHKKQKENRKSSSPTKRNFQSVYYCSVFFRYLLQLLTLYRTVAVYHRSALIRKQCRPERHLIVRPEHHRQI